MRKYRFSSIFRNILKQYIFLISSQVLSTAHRHSIYGFLLQSNLDISLVKILCHGSTSFINFILTHSIITKRDDNHGDRSGQTVCESIDFRRFCTYSQNREFSGSRLKFPLLLTDTPHMDFYQILIQIFHLRKFHVPTQPASPISRELIQDVPGT